MSPPPTRVDAKDLPGQLYIIPLPHDPIPRPTATADRRQAASTMVSELLANSPATRQSLATHFGVCIFTVTKWELGQSSPAGDDFERLHQLWHYLMGKAQQQKRQIHHPTKGR